MEAVFLKLLNMSITASWIALAVIIFRLVFRKAPKWIVCALWALVGLRLLLPFSIESVISLIPTTEPIPQSVIEVVVPDVNVGSDVSTPDVPDLIIPPTFEAETTAPVLDPVVTEPAAEFSVMGVISVIWIVGICAMLLYMLGSYIKVYNKVKASIQIRDSVYVCDNVKTPFILGVIKPRIFLPSSMSEFEIDYVVSHELAHISRRDHYWKPLGFLILSVYWFNPVMWLAYVLLCRDIEFACDERVIKRMSADEKKQYTTVLLNCSMPKKLIAACPLAFGEVGVKNRIKSVLNYKKPAFWIIVLALIASAVVAVCFLTNPVEKTDDPVELGQGEITLSPVEVLYHNHHNTTSEYTAENAPYYRMDEDNRLYRFEKDTSEWEFFAEMQKIELDESNFSERFHRDGESLYGKVCLIDNEELESILQNNKAAYQGWRDHESYQSFYMLLEQNDGTFYVAYGNKENNVSSEDIKNGLIFLLYRAEITKTELPDEIDMNSIPEGASIYYFDSPIFEKKTEELEAAIKAAEPVYLSDDGVDKLKKMLKLNTFVSDAFLDRILMDFDGAIKLVAGGESYVIYFSYEYDSLYCNEHLCGISEVEMERIEHAFSRDLIPNINTATFGGTLISASWIDSDSDIFKNAKNNELLNAADAKHLPIHRIATLKEYNAFKSEYADEVSMEQLDSAGRKYNNSFFENNELFAVYIPYEADGRQGGYKVSDVLLNGDTMTFTLHFDKELGEVPHTEKSGCFVMINIPRDYVIYYATDFDAIDVTDTDEIPEIESKIVKTTSLQDYHPIRLNSLNADNESRIFLHKVESYEKLNEMKNSFVGVKELVRGEMVSRNHEYFSNTFNEQTKEYDEKIFEKNDLFVIYFSYPYIGNEYMGVEVEKSGDTVHFYIPLRGEGPSLFMFESVLAIATLPKSYTEDVSFYYLGFHSYTETNYTQTYTYKSEYEVIPATISLSDNGRFMFSYSGLSSSVPVGEYELTDEKLTLRAVNDKVYVFNVVGEGLAFDASRSDDIPRYRVSAGSKDTYSPVPDGAIFQNTVNIAIPKTLDKAIEWEIRDAYAAGLKNEFGQRMLAEEVRMVEYCGIYNGARVVMLNVDSCEVLTVLTTETVNGTVFEYTDGSYTLRVYNDRRFYSLQSAFDQGILSARDLESIAYIHNRGLYAKPANSNSSLLDLNGYDGELVNEMFKKAEVTASYFTGYARDVYGDESIEYEGVRYDRFTVCDSLEEIRAIVSESFDEQLTERFMSTMVDGLPLYVEKEGKLYRFGGYVALESYESATATINKGEIYDRDTIVLDATVGYSEYRYLLSKSTQREGYKFSVRYMLPIEIATYKR